MFVALKSAPIPIAALLSNSERVSLALREEINKGLLLAIQALGTKDHSFREAVSHDADNSYQKALRLLLEVPAATVNPGIQEKLQRLEALLEKIADTSV